jgi:hypothetical protein
VTALGPYVARSPVGLAVSLTTKAELLDGTLVFVKLVGPEAGVMEEGEEEGTQEENPRSAGPKR